MASKIQETPQKEEIPEKEGLETLPDSPLLDLSNAAVKKLIRSAKKRGYVTHDQINSVLPSGEVNSEQIKDMLAMFSEMGVNVVETEEPSEVGEEQREEPDEEAESGQRGGGASWSRCSRRSRPSPKPRSRPSARMIRCACICAKWARWSFSRARARSPSPSARGRPRGDDRRPVREPAHLPGHHH